jgi:hypothetical protein
MTRFLYGLIAISYMTTTAFCLWMCWFSVGQDLWLSAFISALIAVYSIRQTVLVIVRDLI